MNVQTLKFLYWNELMVSLWRGKMYLFLPDISSSSLQILRSERKLILDFNFVLLKQIDTVETIMQWGLV